MASNDLIDVDTTGIPSGMQEVSSSVINKMDAVWVYENDELQVSDYSIKGTFGSPK